MSFFSLLTKYSRWLIGVSCLVLSGWTIYSYHLLVTIEKDMMTKTLYKVSQDVNEKISHIEDELNKVFNGDEDTIDEFAHQLSSNEMRFKDLGTRLSEAVNSRNYAAVGVHFSDTYDKALLRKHLSQYRVKTDTGRELYAPFFIESDTGEHTVFPYDYTQSTADRNVEWYDESIEESGWYGPYFGSANGKYLISYRAPFGWSEKKGRNAGIVIADYSLKSVRELIQNIELLDSGYCVIFNRQGQIISHPVKEFLSKNVSDTEGLMLDIDKVGELEENVFHNLADAQKGNLAGRERLLLKRELQARGWTIVAVLNRSETLTTDPYNQEVGSHFAFASILHKMRIHFVLVLMMTIFCLVVLVVWQNKKRHWVMSISFSLLCTLTTIVVWYNNQISDIRKTGETVLVENKTDLEAALNTLSRKARVEKTSVTPHSYDSSTKIKTGFFIQSVKFSSANDVFVTGYAWQKTPKGWKEDHICAPDNEIANAGAEIGSNFKKLRKKRKTGPVTSAGCLGFILPEAESLNMKIVYADRDITRWYFEASLRQEFNYLKYPFDEENVWIRARPKNFYDPDVILVPDFDAYPSLEYHKVVGLEDDIFVEGWDISKTFYSFKMTQYKSNFGASVNDPIMTNRPDLYFNITIRREFLGVFVAYMIPIIVIAFLLFAVIMIRAKDSAMNEWLGFNSATVLGYAASLFFVLVISHMSLRETLHAKGIIYLEYFFFSLYIAIAIVSVNSIEFAFRRINGKSDRHVLRYIYWPGLLLSILVATVMRFS